MKDILNQIIEEPQSVIALVALIISFLSIIIGVSSLWIQRIHNRKSVQPIGQIVLLDKSNHLGIWINNTGLGPLIINNIKVSCKGIVITNIYMLVETKIYKKECKIQWVADPTGRKISPGEYLEFFTYKGSSRKKKFIESREKLRKILRHVKIEFTYSDIYNKKIGVVSRNISAFGRHYRKRKKIRL